MKKLKEDKNFIFLILFLIVFIQVGQTQICGTETGNDSGNTQECYELYTEAVTSFEIPVIVHVMYNEDFENVSYGDVVTMIEETNKRLVTEPIVSKGENFDVSITLKLIEGNGCMPGFERIYIEDPDMHSTEAPEDNRIKSSNVWDVNKFFNIWIVRSIMKDGGSVLGYGYCRR